MAIQRPIKGFIFFKYVKFYVNRNRDLFRICRNICHVAIALSQKQVQVL